MANPFAPAQVDFSMLANLPALYAQGQKSAQENEQYKTAQDLQNARKLALTKFNGTNYNELAQALFSAGDLQGGLEAANLAAKPTGRFTSTPYGGALNTETGEVTMPGQQPGTVQQGGTQTAANGGSAINPNWFPTKNADEAKAGAMFRNGAQANAELNALGDVPNNEAGSWSSVGANLEDLPYGIGSVAHSMESANRQRFQDAGRHFINAVNRRESGANVTQSEWRDALQRFIPVYGDKPEQLAAKAKARQEALNGIAGEAGPMFNPTQASPVPSTPEVAAPPPNGNVEAAASGVPQQQQLPPPQQRTRGTTYQTSKGPLVWTGIPGREWMAP